MFVLTRDVSAAKKVIATLLATAIVLWTLGYHATAQAANITDAKDTLSDSAPAASSDHSFVFVTPTGVANGEDIVIDFLATGFDLTGIGTEDIDILIDGVNKPVAEWSLVNSGTDLTLTIDTGSISAGASTTILIGTNATNEGSPDTQIVNPTPTLGNESFEIAISAGTADSGYVRVVILDTVLVTARVATTFDFTVYGIGTTDTPVNGTATTSVTTSSTTIAFGTLDHYVAETAAQDLTVQTNAANGFVVTVQSDGAFRSSTGADIDDFKDGTLVTDPEAWESPSVGLDVNNENTWGHWGVTTEDADTVGNRAFEFAANEWAGVTTTPTVIFAHDGPADSTTPGIGSTTVGYRVEISPLQEAGDDYQTTLTYIATPTF